MFMFQCKTVPTMAIKQYFRRLANYTSCSGEALIMAVMHIARLHRYLSNFPINILTIHRLLLASLVVSAKFFDDSILNNARYARVGGVRGAELNMLEVEFLFLIDFSLWVDVEQYNRIYLALINQKTPLSIKLFEPFSISRPQLQSTVCSIQ
jgi:hypothetical protein